MTCVSPMMVATKNIPADLMAGSGRNWMMRAARQPSTAPTTQVRCRPATLLDLLVAKLQRKLVTNWIRGMMARNVELTRTLS